MSITDVETRHILSITFKELNYTLDWVTAILPILFIKLRQKIKIKYAEPSRTYNILLRLF